MRHSRLRDANACAIRRISSALTVARAHSSSSCFVMEALS